MINITGVGDVELWIITDMHLSHEEGYTAFDRPTDYSKKILASLAKVPEDAIFVDMGDITQKMSTQRVNQFIGVCPAKTKILVRGNHDKKSYSHYIKAGYDFVCEFFYWPGILISHHPIPKDQWPDDCKYNLHGHMHGNNHYGYFGNAEFSKGHLHYNLEEHGMRAMHLNELLKKFGVNFIHPPEIKHKWKICLEGDASRTPVVSKVYDDYSGANKESKHLTKLTGVKHVITYV